jgi:hypothetical protein
MTPFWLAVGCWCDHGESGSVNIFGPGQRRPSVPTTTQDEDDDDERTAAAAGSLRS